MRSTQFLLILVLFCTGCYSTNSAGTGPGVILFVHGAGGDASWYRGIVQGLRDAGEKRPIRAVTWGMGGPLFVMNFNDKGVHDRAEKKLADAIAKETIGPIDVVAHSAGCGVTLGALARLPKDGRVRHVVLLAPSVSPSYDVRAALARVDSLHAFRSDRDTLFLSWRASNFGTYDGVKSKAAGNAGFAASDPKLRQYAWSDVDKSLDNDGDHFGATSRKFVAQRVAPLLMR